MNRVEQDTRIDKAMQRMLFFMVFVSPLLVLQIVRKEVFLWLQVTFVTMFFYKEKKIELIKEPLIVMLFAEPFIAGVFAQFSSMTETYKRTAINLAIMALPLYFAICCIIKLMKDKSYKTIIKIIVNAIKMVVLVELVWIFIQLLLYRLFGVDINQLIFVDLLHLVENASFIRSWIWYPSGLSWHSAVLAPLFVMGILFFDNPVIRILIVIESCVCGNRTTLLGVMCCLLLLLLKTMHMRKIKIEKEKIRLIIVILIAVAAILIVTGIGPKFLIKIFGNGKDASTLAHFGYYSDYFTIIKESSLYQIIFGYGVGCSGYTITSLYGRYADGGTWAIESDFINILVSRGIIGFITYYWFLIRIMIKGFKIDYRYAIFIITVLFQGFGYNIQFDYLLLIEILMYILIENRVNFFDVVDELNAENSKIRREGKRFICRKFR